MENLALYVLLGNNKTRWILHKPKNVTKVSNSFVHLPFHLDIWFKYCPWEAYWVTFIENKINVAWIWVWWEGGWYVHCEIWLLKSLEKTLLGCYPTYRCLVFGKRDDGLLNLLLGNMLPKGYIHFHEHLPWDFELPLKGKSTPKRLL